MKNYFIALVQILIVIVIVVYLSYMLVWCLGAVLVLPAWVNGITSLSAILTMAYLIRKK